MQRRAIILFFLHYGRAHLDLAEFVVKLVKFGEILVKFVVKVKIGVKIKFVTHKPLLAYLQITRFGRKVQFVLYLGKIFDEHFLGDAVAGAAVDDLAPDLVLAKILAVLV